MKFLSTYISKWFRFLPALMLVALVGLFIWNLLEHGIVKHPGQAVFQERCAQCHGDQGEGIKTLVPPLDDREFARHHFDSIPCWLKNGLNHPIIIHGKVYDQPMYPSKLDDIQTANVINYLNNEYFKLDKEVNSAWVRKQWEGCE
ncbi:MAG: cytochrome c [Bacteroidetes bacterium]|nr:cytochrome c [Bacteroidota bacterium]